MRDFSDFLIFSQNQIKPLLKPKNPSEIYTFHNKIKSLSICAKQLHPVEWLDWKYEHQVPLVWSEMRLKTEKLLKIISSYSIQSSELFLEIGPAEKAYPLSDVVYFIKKNFYNREDVYFYLLLGELLQEDNFIIFQLAIAYDKITAPSQHG